MAEQFQAGDVVMLKSGGPRMTVIGPHVTSSGFTDPSQVDVEWFVGETLNSGTFVMTSLKKTESE